MAKLFDSETLLGVVPPRSRSGGPGDETVRSLAARGETPYPVERIWREARLDTIVEGTSEVLRLFLAREALDTHLARAGALAVPGSPVRARVGAFLGARRGPALVRAAAPAVAARCRRACRRRSAHRGSASSAARARSRAGRSTRSEARGGLEPPGLLGRLVNDGADLFAAAAAPRARRRLATALARAGRASSAATPPRRRRRARAPRPGSTRHRRARRAFERDVPDGVCTAQARHDAAQRFGTERRRGGPETSPRPLSAARAGLPGGARGTRAARARIRVHVRSTATRACSPSGSARGRRRSAGAALGSRVSSVPTTRNAPSAARARASGARLRRRALRPVGPDPGSSPRDAADNSSATSPTAGRACRRSSCARRASAAVRRTRAAVGAGIGGQQRQRGEREHGEARRGNGRRASVHRQQEGGLVGGLGLDAHHVVAGRRAGSGRWLRARAPVQRGGPSGTPVNVSRSRSRSSPLPPVGPIVSVKVSVAGAARVKECQTLTASPRCWLPVVASHGPRRRRARRAPRARRRCRRAGRRSPGASGDDIRVVMVAPGTPRSLTARSRIMPMYGTTWLPS